MKSKTKIIASMLVMLIAVTTVFMVVQSYANQSKFLNITDTREGNEIYKITKWDPVRHIWKIVSFDSKTSTDPGKYDEAIYCINPEVGFGRDESTGTTIKEYNDSFDIRDLSTANSNYSSSGSALEKIFLNSTTYHSILWILDNSYLPKQTPAADKALTKQLLYDAVVKFDAEHIDSDGAPHKSLIKRDVLTDNDIEVVQQLALWYFTSDNEKYHYAISTEGRAHFDETDWFPAISLNDTNIAEIGGINGDGRKRMADMIDLYRYFIMSAEANNGGYVKNSTTNQEELKTPSISFTSPADGSITTIESISGTEYFVAGPFNFKETTLTKLPYTLSGSVVDSDGSAIADYKVLDSSKSVLENNTINAELENKDFYIAVPRTNTTITKIKVKVRVDYMKTTARVWTNSDDYKLEQPVVIIEKEPDHKEIEKEVTVKKPEIDLALRKFITKVNGKAPEVSRVPAVDITNLETEKTAKYTHTKTPLPVKTGDLVTYTIRIYNEGEISGYAKEITDDIPEGLKFVVSDSTNIKYMWRLAPDGKSVTTDYLSKEKDDNNLIKAYDKQTMTTLDFKDVEIVFEVTEPNASKRTLTNIAEISNDSDENGNDVTDRDSTPNNHVDGEDDIDREHLVLKYFDLALRKFITQINNTEIKDREPVVDVSGLKNGATTAKYSHPKNPLIVKKGDIVIYTIRVYNEGEISGYAQEITDDIPEGLKFLKDHAINKQYNWQLTEDGKSITTDFLSKGKEANDKDNLIEAFDKDTMTTLKFKDVKVAFEVIEPNNSDRILTNIAEISKDADEDGKEVDDIDSTPGNKLDGEDDIDKEYLKLENFDLSLRKFITKVNDNIITSREPKITEESLEKLAAGTVHTLTYTHPKEPIPVRTGDRVVYTIRVYNEGKLDGTATEITDYIPEGLKFLDNSTINKTYGWELSTDGKYLTTKYLANSVIKAFDKANKKVDYKDVLIEFEVTEPNISTRILRNIAEITADNGDDEDSTPKNVDLDNYTPPTDNSEYQEDDDDYEQIKLQYFDLSLRKFITKINSDEITNRYPVVSLNEDGKLVYNHTKEPITVANNNIVVYTIRVYNEGTMAGYAKEVSDDIPAGLSYLPEHEINKKYEWVLSSDGKTVSTDYLSKEKSDARKENNLLKAFDKTKEIAEGNPDYRDLQIAFKVTETNLPSSRIIINTAEITDDSDEDGNDIVDEDSTPGNNDPDEDDIDKEYLKVKFFDLSLLKWVSKTYITENGKTTVHETGHTGLENPEPVVKVDLDRKNINKVTVKFGYTIKITNEGEIAGYAKEISDYIPEGLKFIKSDNPDWEEKDGKIVTRKLEKTLLQPGESATVEVILTWVNDGSNMGLKVNVAEISEDYNEDGAKDIDSIPDNKKDGEDDIDDAPVLLTIKTGGVPTYVTATIIILTVAAITTIGIILVKKFVLK